LKGVLACSFHGTLFLRLGRIILDRLYIAVPLGLIVGLVMMASMTFLPKLEKTGEPIKNMPYAMGGILLAFFIGAAALFGYHSIAPHYFVWFGLTAVATFMIAIVAKAVPQIRKLKRRV